MHDSTTGLPLGKVVMMDMYLYCHGAKVVERLIQRTILKKFSIN